MELTNLKLINKITTEQYRLRASRYVFTVVKKDDGLIFINIEEQKDFGLSSFAEFVADAEDVLEFATKLKDGEIIETP